ncbi:peptidoglycan-binding domain-containing protein [Streptomyces millisiae]|uniref:Peptidoglycan-binding domain-containing protein n=1 Tax=Streptomyces millisiae TaxID=3075542 RepID=A0ABU2LLX0_9ACTN|nr:peptidoglycan-binding domain-containing protein [Streptomyces sp. DSM 44918]MDT0318584.1 peptidoglycan-binding domain-containing protein [Streptomyces sp. DSM 44918]
MRAKARTRRLVSSALIAGISVGSLGIAGVAHATPAESATTRSAAVTPLATVNFGVPTSHARCLQVWLERSWGYEGPIDGLLGTESWMAYQRYLAHRWGYDGPIDGIVGSGTVSALQRSLVAWGYDGEIDGIPGPETREAFQTMAAAC